MYRIPIDASRFYSYTIAVVFDDPVSKNSMIIDVSPISLLYLGSVSREDRSNEKFLVDINAANFIPLLRHVITWPDMGRCQNPRRDIFPYAFQDASMYASG
jgi:hypothetical protein